MTRGLRENSMGLVLFAEKIQIWRLRVKENKEKYFHPERLGSGTLSLTGQVRQKLSPPVQMTWGVCLKSCVLHTTNLVLKARLGSSMTCMNNGRTDIHIIDFDTIIPALTLLKQFVVKSLDSYIIFYPCLK